MSLMDTNQVLYKYLTTASVATDPLLALVGAHGIYCPRAPENADLPNVTFFTRGGISTPYIPDLPSPSVQFDCWAKDVEVGGVITEKGSIIAREVYRALYNALQGIQNVEVDSNVILSAIEEVQGQDLVDTDIPGRFRVLTFFSIMIR